MTVMTSTMDAETSPPRYSVTKRRIVAAPPERVFAAWTEAEQLKAWWGPADVVCPEAVIDLRIGGFYRIANRFADGRLVWISGRFEVVEPPHRLTYTWTLEPADTGLKEERVTVSFEPFGGGTEVVVLHERIPSAALRDGHAAGWEGCLDGLVALFAA